jgi:hypothetical protein
METYALGSLFTVIPTEVYAIPACSDNFWSANLHNMTICICSVSKAALLALYSYPILPKLLHQSWLSLQDLSHTKKVRLFWVPGHYNIEGNKEAGRLTRMGLGSYFCQQVTYVLLPASIVRNT